MLPAETVQEAIHEDTAEALHTDDVIDAVFAVPEHIVVVEQIDVQLCVIVPEITQEFVQYGTTDALQEEDEDDEGEDEDEEVVVDDEDVVELSSLSESSGNVSEEG